MKKSNPNAASARTIMTWYCLALSFLLVRHQTNNILQVWKTTKNNSIPNVGLPTLTPKQWAARSLKLRSPKPGATSKNVHRRSDFIRHVNYEFCLPAQLRVVITLVYLAKIDSQNDTCFNFIINFADHVIMACEWIPPKIFNVPAVFTY